MLIYILKSNNFDLLLAEHDRVGHSCPRFHYQKLLTLSSRRKVCWWCPSWASCCWWVTGAADCEGLRPMLVVKETEWKARLPHPRPSPALHQSAPATSRGALSIAAKVPTLASITYTALNFLSGLGSVISIHDSFLQPLHIYNLS